MPQDGRLKLSATAARHRRARLHHAQPLRRGRGAAHPSTATSSAEWTLSIEHLGFDAARWPSSAGLGAIPLRLLLVTGPTGSGKTTTLYAVISETNSGREKIITIEDPVEYQLPTCCRSRSTRPRADLRARPALHPAPRPGQDHGRRDARPETAQIAIQAALTGHQVFATVHANNVFDVIGRLSTMGVDPYNLVSALNGVGGAAPRAHRLSCTAARPTAGAERIEAVRCPTSRWAGTSRRGIGCAHCRGTGCGAAARSRRRWRWTSACAA